MLTAAAVAVAAERAAAVAAEAAALEAAKAAAGCERQPVALRLLPAVLSSCDYLINQAWVLLVFYLSMRGVLDEVQNSVGSVAPVRNSARGMRQEKLGRAKFTMTTVKLRCCSAQRCHQQRCHCGARGGGLAQPPGCECAKLAHLRVLWRCGLRRLS